MSDEPDDVRALLADVPAPDADRRERAIAAALAAFDEQMAPRRRSTRWLMPAAAALVAVVALGGVVSQLGGGDDRSDQTLTAPADRSVASSADAESADADVVAPDDIAGGVASIAATELATEMMAADAAGAAPSPATIPTLRTEVDLIGAVLDVRPGGGAAERRACDRTIVTEALDERDPAAPRLVLLAVEPGGDDEADEIIVVLAPPGEPDACTELDRVALP